jgi:hypothetical protein
VGAPVSGVTRTRVLVRTAVTAATLLLGTTGCSKKDERFESVVQIVRKETVELTDDGKAPNVIDMEFEWDPCPGDQFQVIRGDKDFAACAAKYEIGDYVPVVVRHMWDERGYFTWDVERVGDCARAIERGSAGSYEKSQECHDVTHHGHKVGFECSRKPFRDLVKRCPWTARQ